ncbi:Neuromedin-K receptor [Exaiptasia diaphana]|nr:Neuromedin-K receptor [Exaiptasia diaphana]
MSNNKRKWESFKEKASKKRLGHKVNADSVENEYITVQCLTANVEGRCQKYGRMGHLTMVSMKAAIIGNSLVCHIILHTKFVKKTAFNYVLVNLAILDAITSILAAYKALLDGPLYVEGKGDGIMRVYNQSHVGAEIMCKFVMCSDKDVSREKTYQGRDELTKLFKELAIGIMVIDALTLVVASLAIFGNSLVCHIILKSKFVKKTAFNYVLLNLAILDAITSILFVYKALLDGPLYIEGKGDGIMGVYNQSHVGAEIMCKIKLSLRIGPRATPAFLLLIAYERYKAIVTPLSRRTGGTFNRKVKVAILLCWFLGLLVVVIFILSTNVGKKGCFSIIAQWFNPTIFNITVVVLCFLLPTAVMSVLYYKVIKTIREDEQFQFQAAVQGARAR